MNNKNTFIALMIVLFLAGAAGGFVAGKKFSGNKNPMMGQNGADFAGQGRQQGGKNGPFYMGEITEKSDSEIKIKSQNGSAKTIAIPATASITKPAQVTFADLLVGDNISVNGSAGQDGKITAQSIQVMAGQNINKN